LRPLIDAFPANEKTKKKRIAVQNPIVLVLVVVLEV